MLFVNACRTLPFLWALIESLVYRAQMKKRESLGLADPVVTNRFGLFAIWGGALFVLPVAILIIRLRLRALGVDGGIAGSIDLGWVMPLVQGLLVGTGLFAFTALWLSFFPPRFYIERITRRTAAQH